MTLNELEAAWNAQADPFNQWEALGLDEIVAFAQQQALIEAALDDEAGESDLHDMVRWAYSKLHYASYSKLEDALMLGRMKLLLEHGF